MVVTFGHTVGLAAPKSDSRHCQRIASATLMPSQCQQLGEVNSVVPSPGERSFPALSHA